MSRAGRQALLLVLAAAGVAVSLGLRVHHRGLYYPGWDVVGAAHGLFLVAARTPAQILDSYRETYTAWNTYGIPSALLPGWLAAHWPSEWWPHRVTFAIALLCFGLLACTFGQARRDAAVVLLGWGASGVLLTWSVTGFAYVSGVIPYALALWTVHRWRSRPLATLLLGVLTVQSAWHVQELGRTVFVVFLAAALFVREAPWSTRAAWLAAGGWQLWNSLLYQTFNTSNYSSMTVPPLAEGGARLLELGQRLTELKIDLPILLLAGVLAALFTQRDRWFWRALVGFHLGLVVLLAVNTGQLRGVASVWPRRVIVLDFVCLAAVVAFTAAARPRGRAAMLALLAAGTLWQLADVVRWSRRPFEQHGVEEFFTLPFSRTTIDYYVPLFTVDWYRELRDQVDAGRKLLLVYNLTSYDENNTNPVAVLERLYLHLGPARFAESVFAFGDDHFRWNECPVRQLSDLPAFLDGLTDPAAFSGYQMIHPFDDTMPWDMSVKRRSEVAVVLDALSSRFRIAWGAIDRDPRTPDGRTLLRFTLQPY